MIRKNWRTHTPYGWRFDYEIDIIDNYYGKDDNIIDKNNNVDGLVCDKDDVAVSDNDSDSDTSASHDSGSTMSDSAQIWKDNKKNNSDS